ncbi:MAG: GAF domain-containing sensor histidine kinase, partial [Dehalococcoidia bacterium]
RARVVEAQTSLAGRLQVLNDLMRVAVSSFHVAEVIDGIGEQVRRIIAFDRLHIAVHPDGADYVETYAATGQGPPSQEMPRIPLKDSPFGEVIATCLPLLRNDILEDDVYPLERGIARETDYHAMMYVPLKSKGRVIGCLSLSSRQPGSFGEPELQIAQEIADHLAVIIEHALLHEESEQTAATLRVMNKQLAEASRHKSEFLANLSHELRTPLNAILGASELMLDGLFGPLTDKQKEYTRDIHEGGAHLLSLINDVLDLSKVEAGKLELRLSAFDLGPLLESSVAIIRERAAAKSLELKVEPPPQPVVIEADQRKIKQIVYNLLSNAVKFTPENGRVRLQAYRQGDEVIFVVDDTGLGVAEEFQERIFEEFFQVSGDQEGTGLGLALSKRLVELHGGRIWMEPRARAGPGSRFSFAIPVGRVTATESGDLAATE